VSHEEGEALARELKIPFMETSAYENTNVDDAFMRIATDVKARIDSGVAPAAGQSASSRGGASAAGIQPLTASGITEAGKKRRCC
jgi:Ras family